MSGTVRINDGEIENSRGHTASCTCRESGNHRQLDPPQLIKAQVSKIPPIIFIRWTARGRTWGSPSCSRRTLSKNDSGLPTEPLKFLTCLAKLASMFSDLLSIWIMDSLKSKILVPNLDLTRVWTFNLESGLSTL